MKGPTVQCVTLSGLEVNVRVTLANINPLTVKEAQTCMRMKENLV